MKRFLFALAALLWSGAADAQINTPAGGGGTAGAGGTAGTGALTQTIVSLTAATSAALVAANPARRYLQFCNIGGGNPMTYVPGAGPAVAGQGPSLDPGSSAANQSGCQTWEASFIPGNAFQGISTAGTSVSVIEGQ